MSNYKSQAFSAICRRMFGNDDEYRELSLEQKLTWLTLIGGEIPDRCGIFKGCLHTLCEQTGLKLDAIKAALARFEELGWLIREDEYTLITGYILHQSHSHSWMQGAVDSASAYKQRCPGLVQVIKSRYESMIDSGKVGGRPSTIPDAVRERIRGAG